MTDLERGPSSDGESAICATSLNNSSSTLVERLRAPRCGSPIDLAPELDDLCQEAATLISELQAERDELQRSKSAGFAFWKNVARIFNERAKSERAKASRIQSETVEACAKMAEQHPSPMLDEPNVFGAAKLIAKAIRSLKLPDYRGGEAKTAEGEHSPSTLNAETE